MALTEPPLWVISYTNKCYKRVSLMLKGGSSAAATSFLVLRISPSGRRMRLVMRHANVWIYSMILGRLRLESSCLSRLIIQVRTSHHSIVLLGLVEITTYTSMWLVGIKGIFGLRSKISVDVDTNIYITWMLVMDMLLLIRHVIIAHAISLRCLCGSEA